MVVHYLFLCRLGCFGSFFAVFSFGRGFVRFVFLDTFFLLRTSFLELFLFGLCLFAGDFGLFEDRFLDFAFRLRSAFQFSQFATECVGTLLVISSRPVPDIPIHQYTTPIHQYSAVEG